MNIEIASEIFLRLAAVSKTMPLSITDHEKDLLRCVRFEFRDGKKFAIASNRKIAVVYMLGLTPERDQSVHIRTEPALIEQLKREKVFNSVLKVIAMPELGAISVSSNTGYAFQGNPGFFSESTPLKDWPTWIPKNPIEKSQNGAMQWSTECIQTINEASVSGYVNFPEFIDALQPVILRDKDDENWIAMFMPNCADEKTKKVYTCVPATLPAWWIK